MVRGFILPAVRRWRDDRSGAAMMETAILFPVLLVMLFGIYDVGHAITANHKMITASQVAADLLTRSPTVSDQALNQAIEAAGLAMRPYADGDSIGIDIVSVRFDSDDDPQPIWRETRNMSVNDNINPADRAVGLGTSGEGVMVVTLLYDYEPTFGTMVIEKFRMREVAFARGRRSSVVGRE